MGTGLIIYINRPNKRTDIEITSDITIIENFNKNITYEKDSITLLKNDYNFVINLGSTNELQPYFVYGAIFNFKYLK